MIRCRAFAELVTGFLEGTLAPTTRAQVRFHLLFCPNCRAYLEQMREAVRALRRVGSEAKAPDGTKAALREKLRARRKPEGGS